MWKSCFEGSRHLKQLIFENGSKLLTIGHSALAGCESLASIVIPPQVAVIEDEAFTGCSELEYCLLTEEASLVTIGKAAFADCHSLSFFDIPRMVESIGQDCFKKCFPLSRLTFDSADSLKRVLGQMVLDSALEHFGFSEISSVFTIEVTEGGVNLEFPGWSSVVDADSHLTIVKAM
jgi:hypothetical protein